MYLRKIFLVFCLVIIFSGCATIHGYGIDEKRNFVGTMKDLALEELFDIRPQAKQQIADAAGYAVFSNINSHVIFVSAGSGYGVVTNNATNRETYMRMFNIGGGFGLGLKDYRAIIIFKKQEDLERFINGGWDFSGNFDATLKSQDKGGAISGAKSFDRDIITYQLTEAGLALQATLQGAKFWKDAGLN